MNIQVRSTAAAITAEHLAHPTRFARPWDGSEWLFELSMTAFAPSFTSGADQVALTSRNGRSLLMAFPEIKLALLDLNVDGVFDGELVVPDETGKPDWHELRRRSRMTRRESILHAAQQSPAVLCVFDVLIAGTQDLRERWQLKRKEWLRDHLPEIGQ